MAPQRRDVFFLNLVTTVVFVHFMITRAASTICAIVCDDMCVSMKLYAHGRIHTLCTRAAHQTSSLWWFCTFHKDLFDSSQYYYY